MNALFTRNRRTILFLLLAIAMMALSGCAIDPNADVNSQLTNAGTEIKGWIPLLRVVVYGILGLGWVWYGAIYALSLFGMESYWQKHRDWWKGGAAITLGLGIISETVIGFIG